MKRKIVSAVVLAVVSLAVLFVLASEPVDYGYYFRDNIGFPPGNGLEGCYFDFPWATEVDLTAEAADLLAEKLLPELPGYSVTSIYGRYRADGGLYGVEVQWNAGQAETADMLLDIFAEKPQDLGWARVHVMNYDQVTITEVDDVTVYGDGTMQTPKVLEFTGTDGTFYQIQGYGVTVEDMGAVLDYCLKNGVDLSTYN